MVRKKGETQCVGFVASFLDDAYTLEGEPILESAAALLGQVLLDPATENGVFRADYVAGEKANLLDRIRGQINDKRVYASHRLAQVMCREEAFGVDKLGDETSAASVTPDSLWQRYQALLNTAAVEVYYSGSAQPERVERCYSMARTVCRMLEEKAVSYRFALNATFDLLMNATVTAGDEWKKPLEVPQGYGPEHFRRMLEMLGRATGQTAQPCREFCARYYHAQEQTSCIFLTTEPEAEARACLNPMPGVRLLVLTPECVQQRGEEGPV